jgi:hypothetical protein
LSEKLQGTQKKRSTDFPRFTPNDKRICIVTNRENHAIAFADVQKAIAPD